MVVAATTAVGLSAAVVSSTSYPISRVDGVATDLALVPAAQALREAVAALRWTLISRVHRPIHKDLPGVEERAARIDAFVADRLPPPSERFGLGRDSRGRTIAHTPALLGAVL